MEPEKKSNGAMIGLVIIIIILVIGGIYIWLSQKNAPATPPATQASLSSEDAAAIDGLDNDLNNTNTDVTTDVNSVR